MIASLGMYDLPAAQAANDRLWHLIRDGMRRQGLTAPDDLTRGENAYWPAWTAPDLVFSQTCGFPYRARLHSQVTLIGTPDYGVAGCEPGYYASVLVVRAADPRRGLADFDGAALAFNEEMSQSGWAAPQAHAAVNGISLHPRLRTGGHLFSARAVAKGRADIAAIDAVTWGMIAATSRDLRVLDQTAPTPGLPYIAAKGADGPHLFAIVAAAIADLSQTDRATLQLRGLVAIPKADYLAIPIPPPPADLGFAPA